MKPPLAIPDIQNESHTQYLLRLAAAYIREYAPDKPLHHADYGVGDDPDPVTGIELVESMEEEIKELEDRRSEEESTIRIRGTLIQAGGDGKDPTMTLITSKRELQRQTMIPLYHACEVCYTPLS